MTTCIGDKARQLLEETTLKMAKAKSSDQLLLIWADFVKQCEALVSAAERQFDEGEHRNDRLRAELRTTERDLEDLRTSQTADLQLCERIVYGTLKLDDYCLARKRGWPFERLEQLAGVR